MLRGSTIRPLIVELYGFCDSPQLCDVAAEYGSSCGIYRLELPLFGQCPGSRSYQAAHLGLKLLSCSVGVSYAGMTSPFRSQSIFAPCSVITASVGFGDSSVMISPLVSGLIVPGTVVQPATAGRLTVQTEARIVNWIATVPSNQPANSPSQAPITMGVPSRSITGIRAPLEVPLAPLALRVRPRQPSCLILCPFSCRQFCADSILLCVPVC
jgi:hypothetical protein